MNYSDLPIHQPDPRIAAFYPTWKRNRDMVEGERTVKAAGGVYLPLPDGLDDSQTRNIIARTPFFPGAARTAEGLKGLIFRKPAKVQAPDAVLPMLNTITYDGYNLDDLAEDVFDEWSITNFVGLVTDYPVSDGTRTKAQALEAGLSPYITMYPGESILGIETARVNFRQRVIRVRLLEETDKLIRELQLVDNVYTVTEWNCVGGQWQRGDVRTPTRNGKTMNEIPFSLVTTNRKYLPAKAKLADVCDINAQHFIAANNYAMISYYVGNPTPYLFGVKDGKISFAPGTFLTAATKSTDIKIGFLSADADAMGPLASEVSNLANDMAKVGSRILASEKVAVEAAETLAIKTASENAALASSARLISRWINDQLRWVAYFLDLEEGSITYELNTNYGESKLSKDEVASLKDLYDSGIISLDTLLDLYIAGDVLPEEFDKDADRAKIDQEVRDRPPVDAIIPASGEDEPSA